MKTRIILAVALCMSSSGLMAQSSGNAVYSWVDANGARHYSDRPPVGRRAAPIEVDVSKPASAGASIQGLSSVPTADTTQAAAEKQKRERAEDCEVARNNLRLLDDPKSQVVEKGVEGSKPMDDTARIEARALAERQVQDFCR